MGFQDNSGDIILDVVLTDEGRKRLAAGRFSITKFALGDDEINYELFNVGASTALQDLSILQTPILEAFTNNTASMKSKLLYGVGTGTAGMMNVWYLPTMLLNTQKTNSKTESTTGVYVVTANSTTYSNSDSTGIGRTVDGALQGVQNGAVAASAADGDGQVIRVDAGYNTGDSSLIQKNIHETGYNIIMDDRLLKLANENGPVGSGEVDDDGFAIYNSFGFTNQVGSEVGATAQTPLVAGGWLTGFLEFKLMANTTNLISDYLFDNMGGTTTMAKESGVGTSSIRYIDTNVRIVGINLGSAIDIPIRVVKLV